MIHAQDCKYVNLTPPGALVDNASLTIAELDTKGWDYLTVLLILGATDIGVTAMQLTESDTTGTGHAAITGTVWETATTIDGATSVYPAATDDNDIFAWQLDLRKRKRFIDGTITIGNGTAGGYYVVLAILSRGEIVPSSSAAQGCNQICRV